MKEKDVLLDKKSSAVEKGTNVNKTVPKRKKAPPKKAKESTSNISKSKKATTNTMARAANIEPVDSNIESKNEDKKDSKLITKPEKKKETFKQKVKRIWHNYTTYEKSWFFSIVILSIIVAILFPEEDMNGVNGGIIMGLYLADVFLNILCELMLSKQDKWNFIVSLVIEVIEIITLLILSAMFASIATILFFWIPIDIMSFISWSKHKDQQEEELTEVRQLNWWQNILFFLAVTVWTVTMGYVVAKYAPDTDFFEDDIMKRNIAYIDACESAIGVANGLFIMLRYKEQWWTWIAATILEATINIITGQWVLLVLKVGYLTNSIYGYIKWSKYIKHKKDDDKLITKVENTENTETKELLSK